MYETGSGKTTTTRCMPVNEEYRETPYKKKMMENTDEVEMLQYVSLSLVLLDLVLNIYKLWAARLQTMQILASTAAVQPNTPIAQRRNSQYSIAMS